MWSGFGERKVWQGLTKAADRQKNYDSKVVKRRFPRKGNVSVVLVPPVGRKKMGRGWAGPYLVVRENSEQKVTIQESEVAKERCHFIRT